MIIIVVTSQIWGGGNPMERIDEFYSKNKKTKKNLFMFYYVTLQKIFKYVVEILSIVGDLLLEH
jgi:hypothetical protein